MKDCIQMNKTINRRPLKERWLKQLLASLTLSLGALSLVALTLAPHVSFAQEEELTFEDDAPNEPESDES